jgi:hypothetical protein
MPGAEPGDSSWIGFTTEIVTDIEGIRALRPDYEHLHYVTEKFFRSHSTSGT